MFIVSLCVSGFVIRDILEEVGKFSTAYHPDSVNQPSGAAGVDMKQTTHLTAGAANT